MTTARRAQCVGLLLTLLSAPVFAVDISPGGDLRAAIAALRPGQELVLAGGTYTVSSGFSVTVVGTEAQPIVMRAKTGERPLHPP